MMIFYSDLWVRNQWQTSHVVQVALVRTKRRGVIRAAGGELIAVIFDNFWTIEDTENT